MSTPVKNVYYSISEYGRYLRGLGEARNPICKPHSRESFPEYQTAGFSLDSAIDSACKGGLWVEGAKDLAAVKFDVDQEFETTLNTMRLDVAGFMPCVPHAVMNLPNAMLNTVRESKPSRIVKIGVSNCFAGGTDQSIVVNRGRAILEVIDRLEKIGYSIELWSIMHTAKNGHSFTSSVRIKASNERANLSSIAFALCSPAWLRRLAFREMESCTGGGAKMAETGGYGMAGDIEGTDLYNYDVYFRTIDREPD